MLQIEFKMVKSSIQANFMSRRHTRVLFFQLVQLKRGLIVDHREAGESFQRIGPHIGHDVLMVIFNILLTLVK